MKLLKLKTENKNYPFLCLENDIDVAKYAKVSSYKTIK